MKRKKLFRNPGFQAVLVAIFFGLATSSGAYTTNFYACYTGAVDTVSNDVVCAAGPTNVTVLYTNAAYEVNPFTEETEGVAVGTNQASLRYSTAGNNLPTHEGSVEIWFKPIDWLPQASNNCMLFQTVNTSTPPAKLYIYKAGTGGITAYFTTNGINKVILNKNITNWQNHIYHHVVVTYNVQGSMMLYVDGTLAESNAIGYPSSPYNVSWPTNFTVGPASTGLGRDSQTAIRWVKIYDTALSSNDVKLLTDNNNTNGLQIGAHSDWFTQNRPTNGLGQEALAANFVPPQWTNYPVQYDDDTRIATCWNRSYNFSNAASILTSVQSGTNALLSEPVYIEYSFVGSSDTNPITLSDPVTNSAKCGPGRLVFSRSLTGWPGGSATLEYTLEYDGLLSCDLQLPIQANAALDYLALNAVFKKDVAQLMHYVGAPTDHGSQNRPEHAYGKMIPYITNAITFDMKTMVWIGNNQNGMLWCTESDQYWWPKTNNVIYTARTNNNDLHFAVAMVTQAFPTTGQDRILNYRFGLMATPIKPLPLGWRGWTVTEASAGLTNNKRGTITIYQPGEYRFMLPDQDPTRFTDNITNVLLRMSTNDHATGRSVMPYLTRTSLKDLELIKLSVITNVEAGTGITNYYTNCYTKVHPEFPLMSREWGVIPYTNNAVFTRASAIITTNRGWSDYLVWCLKGFTNAVTNLPPDKQSKAFIDGIYLDEVQPFPNSRAESGGGYDDFDGTRRPTYQMSGTRELMKRMAYVIDAGTTNPPRSIAHCSGTLTANAIGAFDLWLIGENYNIDYFSKYPALRPPTNTPGEEVYYYSYALPMDRVRAECYPQQWGQVMVWLPQFKGQDNGNTSNSVAARDMLSRVMQADVLVWPFLIKKEEVYTTWDFRRAFGVGDTNVTFHPYWEQNEVTASRASPYERWWTFNSTTGTNAFDSSGFTNHATLKNMATPSCWTNGVAGKALYFSNNADYVDCGTNIIWSSMPSYTVSCWLKPGANSVYRHLIESADADSGFLMQLNDNNALCAYQYVDGDISAVATSVPFPQDGEFHHVAVTFNNGGGTTNILNVLKTYIDGTLGDTQSSTGTPNSASTVSTKIGHGEFIGVIDDVKIHHYALSDAEIGAEFTNSRYRSVWLKFNDAFGTNAIDSSSYGLNGHLTNMNLTTAWSNNNSIRFSGVSTQYVNCGTSPQFGATNYTVELWVNPDIASNNVGNRQFVETRPAGVACGFYMMLHTNAELYTYQSVTGGIYAVAGHTSFPHDGSFHHAAMTFGYTNGTSTLKTYVDGVLKVTKSTAGHPDLTLTNMSLKIGKGPFSGNIKDFKFHTRVLSDTEIAASAAQSDAVIAQAAFPDVVAGYYSRSGSNLVLVSNLSRQPCAVKVDFSGLTTTNTVEDAEITNGTSNLSLTNGCLILEMKRNDYRALILK